ncbi:MAG: diaminopimelate epimerase [Chitinispirillia bacterium]|jgi:diaminopimelate epimerase
MKFHKYHGLGNDYIVIDPEETDSDLTPETIKLICDRNYGAGSDGILYGPEIIGDVFGLKIFNPDGSEAEKSGNGLRIFSRYLWEKRLVKDIGFKIKTPGGTVISQVYDRGNFVRIEMGKVSFDSADIPVAGEIGECIQKKLEVGGKTFSYNAATVGNPHCVIIMDDINPNIAKTYGPLLETHEKFPNRTNVQFVKIIDDSTIQIEIWERGAGYTLASGSSSTAAAAVACRLARCGRSIRVKMQGGELTIDITDDFYATMAGPVAPVFDGDFREEFIEELKKRAAADKNNL